MRSAFLSLSAILRAGALVAVAGALATRPLAAQSTAADAAALRTSYLASLEEVQGKFLQLAEAFPADKYAWRPAPGVRSVGEVFMHVASEYYAWSPRSFGAQPSPVVTMTREGFQKFESSSTKDSVLKHLKEGYAFGRQAVSGVDPATLTGTKKFFGQDATTADIALGMSGDLHEHLGQLIAYARMNGIKPPRTK
jgi:uncharacterized damage-inducible protein DinB